VARLPRAITLNALVREKHVIVQRLRLAGRAAGEWLGGGGGGLSPASVPPDSLARVTATPQPPGVFISFEGGDGAGKSTQVRLLAQWFVEHGREVVVTFEPGDTVLGATLREAVQHGEDLDPRTEALLYAADRAHHVATVVRPALERGAVVITDRYLDSSVAYQGAARALGAAEVEQLSLWATEGLLPQLTVLLDLDPVAGAARLTGSPDRIERAGDEFHRAVREAFLTRAEADTSGRWLVLDASSTPDVLHDAVRERAAQLVGVAR